MQGRKELVPKMMYQVHIGDLVPKDNLQYLDNRNINAWILNFGQFTPERKGFTYNKELNQYECQQGNRAILPFKNARTDNKGYTRHCYRSSESVCKINRLLWRINV